MRKLKTVCITVLLVMPIPTKADSWTGNASYYSGNKTASGARVHDDAMTAAHRTLPFGTAVKVTNLENGRSVHVVINDRGPFVRGRVIDVSVHAAEALAFRNKGLARVRVDTVGD